MVWCVVELDVHRIELWEKNREKMSPKPFVVVSHSRHCSNRLGVLNQIPSTSSSAFELGEVWRIDTEEGVGETGCEL